jgi:hypothetical protein
MRPFFLGLDRLLDANPLSRSRKPGQWRIETQSELIVIQPTATAEAAAYRHTSIKYKRAKHASYDG